MTALDKLNCRFALADTAVAEDENALAVYFNKHAVPCDTFGKRHIQRCDERCHKIACRLRGAEKRSAVFLRKLFQFGEYLQSARHDDSHDIVSHEFVDRLISSGASQRIEVAVLHVAYHLYASAFEIVEKARKRQSGTAHVGASDVNIIVIFGNRDDFKGEFVCYVL